MENKNVFNSFLNCTRLPLLRIFIGSLFHRVGPVQANAHRPKRSKFTFGTSSAAIGEGRAGVVVPRDTLACRRIKPCARVLVACIRYAF